MRALLEEKPTQFELLKLDGPIDEDLLRDILLRDDLTLVFNGVAVWETIYGDSIDAASTQIRKEKQLLIYGPNNKILSTSCTLQEFYYDPKEQFIGIALKVRASTRHPPNLYQLYAWKWTKELAYKIGVKTSFDKASANPEYIEHVPGEHVDIQKLETRNRYFK